MTDAEKIAMVKILARLYSLWDTGKKTPAVPSMYETLQCEIAAYLVNKRGAEGEIAHGENGVSRTYASPDVPDDMLRDVVPLAGVL